MQPRYIAIWATIVAVLVGCAAIPDTNAPARQSVAGIAQQWRTGTGEPGGVFVLCDTPHCLTASPKTVTVSAVTLPARTPLQPQVKDVLLFVAHFESGSAVLSPEDRQGLQNVLGQTQNAHIQVDGYTDATGSEDYNRGLAQQRAQALDRNRGTWLVLLHNHEHHPRRPCAKPQG